jgi:hypothetical protein
MSSANKKRRLTRQAGVQRAMDQFKGKTAFVARSALM